MEKKIKKTLSSHKETKKIAQSLAKEIEKKHPNPSNAAVIALEGNLGSGKTKFTQFFAKSLGIKNRVVSPTFLIMKEYTIPKKMYKKFFHIDAYRIKEKDLINLGFKEITKDPKNIVVVEWADRVKKLIPQKAIWLKFSHGKNNKERLIEQKNGR
jgi:tRNA threonylcarbamoyladenosine biosynthesis protein TsaE